MTTREALERIAKALEAAKPAKSVMSVEEAADYLNVSPNTIYNLVNLYNLKSYRLTDNGCVRFRKEDLDSYVKSREIATVEDHRRMLGGRP